MELSQKLMYILLTVIPLGIAASFDLWLGRRFLHNKRFWLLALIVGIFTLIFDTLLTGIPVVTYDPAKILGFYVGTIPVEDFIYGFTLLIVILSADVVWNMLSSSCIVFLKSSRPFSWINTAYPFALAYYLSGKSFTGDIFLVLLYFLFPYNLLVYGVNDIFDFETDSKNPHKQSIEGALVRREHHGVILWLALSLSVLFLPIFFTKPRPELQIIWLFGLVNAVVYSMPPVRLKIRPFLDSMSSSLHFVFPAVIGIMLGEVRGTPWLALVGFFSWGMASHIIGAIRDIKADAIANLRTVATTLGKKRSGILASVLYGSCALISLAAGVPLLIVMFLLPYIGIVLLIFWKNEYEKRIFRIFMYYNLVFGAVVTVYVLLIRIVS